LKFRRNAPLKKLRNLSLSLKRGDHDGFEAYRGAWTDRRWYLGVCGHWLERAATAGQGIMWMFVRYEKIMEEKKSLSRDSSMIDFFKSSSGTPASPSVPLENGDDEPYVKRRRLVLQKKIITCKLFVSIDSSFSLVKTDCLKPSSHFNNPFVGKV